MPFGPIVGVLFGAVAGTAAGFAYIYLDSRRSKSDTNSMAPTLVTLGMLFAIGAYVATEFGTNSVHADVYPGVFQIGDLRIPWSGLVNVAVVLAIGLGVTLFLRFTRVGRWMRACAVNPTNAPLVGVPVRFIQVGTFALVGTIAGIGGLLLVASRGVFFNDGFALAVLGIGALLVFGMRGLGTAIGGGMALGLVESLGTGYLSAEIAPIMVPLVLLAVLVFGRFDFEAGVSRP
jgi:branched-chain amino acid transport system permease protein